MKIKTIMKTKAFDILKDQLRIVNLGDKYALVHEHDVFKELSPEEAEVFLYLFKEGDL